MDDILSTGQNPPNKMVISEAICNDLYDVLEDGMGEHIPITIDELLKARMDKLNHFEIKSVDGGQEVSCNMRVHIDYLDKLGNQHDNTFDLILKSKVNIVNGNVRIIETYLQGAEISAPISGKLLGWE